MCFTKLWLAIHSAILGFAFQQTIREENLAQINFFFHSSAILWFAFQQTIREKNLAPINIIPAFLVVFFPKSLLRNKSEPKEYNFGKSENSSSNIHVMATHKICSHSPIFSTSLPTRLGSLQTGTRSNQCLVKYSKIKIHPSIRYKLTFLWSRNNLSNSVASNQKTGNQESQIVNHSVNYMAVLLKVIPHP